MAVFMRSLRPAFLYGVMIMAKKQERFVKTYSAEGFVTTKEIYVDRETGVNYLFVSEGNAGGLTPLIDHDGKPLITPINDYDE